jgi:hypothetical protein
MLGGPPGPPAGIAPVPSGASDARRRAASPVRPALTGVLVGVRGTEHPFGRGTIQHERSFGVKHFGERVFAPNT